jgi:glutaredoxin
MDRIETIDRELAALREQYAKATGTQTEVYTRIVGYYRSLANWNKGKREEYDVRKTFRLPGPGAIAKMSAVPTGGREEPDADAIEGLPVRYELFTRERCPRCPAMKAAAANLDFHGDEIDVDTDEGTARAIELSIYSTPTIVLFDDGDREIVRATSPRELETVVPLAVS